MSYFTSLITTFSSLSWDKLPLYEKLLKLLNFLISIIVEKSVGDSLNEQSFEDSSRLKVSKVYY